MKSIWLLLVCLITTQIAFSQFNETIRTGRPGQAIGPFSVGKNVFQTQTGFDIGGVNQTNPDFSSNYLNPNTVLRYGITEKFEINSAISYITNKAKFDENEFNSSGLNNYTIGTRINVINNLNNGPSLGFQGTVFLPIGFGDYENKSTNYKLMAITTQSLSNKFGLGFNLGYIFNTEIGDYVINLSYSINDKWGTFIEAYGTFDQENFDLNWDTGLAYLLNNNLQFDIYGGIDSIENGTTYFTSLGVSWRITPKSK